MHDSIGYRNNSDPYKNKSVLNLGFAAIFREFYSFGLFASSKDEYIASRLILSGYILGYMNSANSLSVYYIV